MIGLLTNVDALLSIICYGSFTWGVLVLFRRDGPLSFAIQSLGVAGTIFALIQWWILSESKPGGPFRAFGALVFISSLALFWWSVPYARRGGLGLAFAADRGAELIFVGPYRWIRHPFYASYMLYWIAGAVGAGEPLLLISLAVMSAFYLPAIFKEERVLLSRRDGAAYAEYRRRTGMLLPALTPWSRARRG